MLRGSMGQSEILGRGTLVVGSMCEVTVTDGGGGAEDLKRRMNDDDFGLPDPVIH